MLAIILTKKGTSITKLVKIKAPAIRSIQLATSLNKLNDALNKIIIPKIKTILNGR